MWFKIKVWFQNLLVKKQFNEQVEYFSETPPEISKQVDREVIFSINIPVSEKILNLYEEATSTVEICAVELEKLNKWNTSLQDIDGFLNTDDAESFKMLIDLQSLLLISMMDLAMISKSLFITTTIPAKAFYIKHSYLLIHEFISIFDHDRGHKLRTLVTEKYLVTNENYKKTVKSLSTFKKTWKYEGEMKKVRDKVSGHIDGDFELWYSIINSFDFERCAQMIIAFQSVLNEFLVLSKDIQQQVKKKIDQEKATTTNNLNSQLDDLERIMQKVNAQQSDGSKLDFDFTELRRLSNL